MEMWNQKLTNENFQAFYDSTVAMVYSSVFQICKETTRTEQAIVDTYVEIYKQRNTVPGEEVLYVFGDILLNNANDVVEKFPLPENLTFAERVLDEYTKNSMYDKIMTKVNSTTFKVAEFISSDNKKTKSGKKQKSLIFSAVTPLLVFSLVLVALIIWGVSYALVTLPYRNDDLVSDSKIYSDVSLQDKYIGILDYLPLNIDYPNGDAGVIPEETVESTQDSEVLAPSIAETEPSATRG